MIKCLSSEARFTEGLLGSFDRGFRDNNGVVEGRLDRMSTRQNSINFMVVGWGGGWFGGVRGWFGGVDVECSEFAVERGSEGNVYFVFRK